MHKHSVIVDRFERGHAVLRFEEGSEVHLPKRRLPGKIKEGTVLYCEFYLAEDEETRREDIARYLLKEILKTHD